MSKRIVIISAVLVSVLVFSIVTAPHEPNASIIIADSFNSQSFDTATKSHADFVAVKHGNEYKLVNLINGDEFYSKDTTGKYLQKIVDEDSNQPKINIDWMKWKD